MHKGSAAVQRRPVRAAGLRVLFAAHNAYTDSNSGAARSVRTLLEWLADAGYRCRVLCTARFDANPPERLADHLQALGLTPRLSDPPPALLRHLARTHAGQPPCPVLHYRVHGLPVTQVVTRHHQLSAPSRIEYEQLVFAFDRIVAEFRPDLVVSVGAHPIVGEFMRRAKAYGARTLFTVRNHGYEHPEYFRHADNCLLTSPYLARQYREKIGLAGTGIASPIHWQEVLAPTETRACVTLVNPSPRKGLLLFARLAQMLGRTRPDIPLLVVQSAASAVALGQFAGLGLERYPQILCAPGTRTPAEFLALTRILLVPSLFDEPFGRVAAEAMINGIPPLVSTRGALPETVGAGGIILPVPDGLTAESTQVPTEMQVRSWYEAVCRLWDDPAAYALLSAKATAAAALRYDETSQRRRYEAYCRAAVRTPGLVDRAGLDAP